MGPSYQTFLISLASALALWWAWQQSPNSLAEKISFWVGVSFTVPLLGLWEHRLFSLGPTMPWWALILLGLISGGAFALIRPLQHGWARTLGFLAFALSGPGLCFFKIALRQGGP